ncbi:helicase-related protein [Peribacillus frigoritolerans]|nr:helicase-related protein [Peribacillus frigoritolerans]
MEVKRKENDMETSEFMSKVNHVLNSLKDFQITTVERVFNVMTCSKIKQNRVLVADEVGLGKTLIARGVIAKLSDYFFQQGKKSLNVVYICSNQSIANQNLKKLHIFKNDNIEKTTESRLTMLPIKSFKQEHVEDFYLNFIPLTPNTSFYLTDGGGMARERVVLYLLLKRMSKLEGFESELSDLLRLDVEKNNWERLYVHPEGEECIASRYEKELNDEMAKAFEAEIETNRETILHQIIEICQNRVHVERREIRRLIGQLRQITVEVSIQCLHPDFVILDEFQRFKTLISHHDLGNDVQVIADKFFARKDLRILLLSATPYKLYSTSEELADGEDHYQEFEEVIHFLVNHEESFKSFIEKWRMYTDSLVKQDALLSEDTIEKKESVENLLRGIMCRTERVSVSKDGNAMIDTSKVKAISVNEKDISAYVAVEKITNTLKELTKNVSSPMEYYKSVPYMFSFMEKYRLKKNLEKWIIASNELQQMVRRYPEIWLDKKKINQYQKLNYPNALFRELLKDVFEQNSEKLLWVPPSNPYYELRGAFKGSKSFSKYLVFSHWEMVPRMISTLVSYEAERRTIGKLSTKKKDKQKLQYFAKEGQQRNPKGRLTFQTTKTKRKKRPASMSNMTLLYPCITFAQDILSRNQLVEAESYEELMMMAKKQLIPYIEQLKPFQVSDDETVDYGWYWAAPLLMDILHYNEQVVSWFEHTEVYTEFETKNASGDSPFLDHFYYLKDGVFNPYQYQLGKIPDDLVDVLILQILGSPAVIALSTLSHHYQSEEEEITREKLDLALLIADEFRNKFNLPESISIIDLTYNRKLDYWRKVMQYCADGNLQSVLDEYTYLIRENYNLHSVSVESIKEAGGLIRDTINLRSANFKVDTQRAFLNRNDQHRFNLRTHFAVSFSNRKTDEKSQGRTDDMRQAFNSPFRPFVLSTTSIGQEGLDFHWYCRKIVHWNLPSNPVELEQREGRINRYKGLVIRKNVANKYAHTSFDNNKPIWDQLFDASYKGEKGEHCDIVPFWLMEDVEDAAKIERIIYQYPYSKDISTLERLLKILSLYRISLGQVRQEEFLTFLMENYSEEDIDLFQKLIMNLSPFYYEDRS